MKEYFLTSIQNDKTAGLKTQDLNHYFAYLILTVVFVGLSIYLFKKTKFAEYIYVLSACRLLVNFLKPEEPNFEICFGDTKPKNRNNGKPYFAHYHFLIFLLYKQLFPTSIVCG